MSTTRPYSPPSPENDQQPEDEEMDVTAPLSPSMSRSSPPSRSSSKKRRRNRRGADDSKTDDTAAASRSHRRRKHGRRRHRNRKIRATNDTELEDQEDLATTAVQDTNNNDTKELSVRPSRRGRRRRQPIEAEDEEQQQQQHEDQKKDSDNEAADEELNGEDDDSEDNDAAAVEDTLGPQREIVRTVPHLPTGPEKAMNTALYTTRVTHQHPVTLTALKNLQKQQLALDKIATQLESKSQDDEYKRILAEECRTQQKYLEDKYVKLEEEFSAVYRRVDKEKEGLFVNQPSFLMKHNRHIVEQRAFRSEGGISSCFDENGQLLYLSNPFKSVFTKPDEQEFGVQSATDLIELKRTRPVLSTLTTSSDRPEYRLNIDVKMLKFKDHELMIEEEYLGRQLVDMFEAYTKRSKSSLIEYYSDKIKALKYSLVQMRQKLSKMREELQNTTSAPSTDGSASQDKLLLLDRRMYRIRQELKENRKLLQDEKTHRVEIVNNIIRTWNQMKEVRKSQDFMVTRYAVSFKQVEHDREEDMRVIEAQVQDELEEAREDADYEFRQKQTTFDRTVINDDESLAEFPMLPEAPDFNERKVRKQIRKGIMEAQREPGAPEYIPQIGTILRTEKQVPASEEERGISFRKYKYFVKVRINGNTVNRTKTKHLNRDFTVIFGEILPVSLYKWPDNIVLEVFRKDGLRSRKIASLYVQAPGATSKEGASSDLGNAVSENSNLEQNYVFSQEKSHPTVWDEDKMHNTTGELQLRMNWVDQIPPYEMYSRYARNTKKILSTDDTHLPTAKDLLDMQNIQTWMKGNKIDPNDPKNTGLMSMLELLEDKVLSRNGFYLAEQDDDLFINSFNDMRYRQRLERLKEMDDSYAKRKRKHHVSKHVREPPLPALNLGIFSSLWAFFEPRRPLKPTRRDRSQDISRKIDQASMFIQIIRGHNVPVRASQNEYHKHRERMYQQKEQLMDQQLNTNRLTGTTTMRSTMLQTPTLSDARQAEEMDASGDESVVSFVSCYFQGRSRKTKIVEGPYPQFNQTINMPITVPNDDFSSDVVKSIKDVLYFDIFDEITITNLKDDQYLHDISKRAEFRWIGGFSIPFSTLYRAGKVLGTFTVKTPPINLGYKYRDENDQTTRLTICITVDPPLPQPEDIADSISSGEMPSLYSYVNWWTKIMENNPNCKNRIISALEPNNYGKATLVCRYICPQQPPTLLLTGDDFQEATQTMEVSYSSDESENEKRKSNLREMETPQGDEQTPDVNSTFNITNLPFEKRQALVHKLARFVSLIPFVDDIVAFLERTDVWQTSQEFLADGGGDHEEHAILLCNYFKYLQKKAWVLVGRAVPEGETAYVLSEEEREVESASGFSNKQTYFLLWNAATGEAFDATDPTCPVFEVGCVFDETNVWANIQKAGKPHRISFDLNNRSHWQPLFRGNKMKSLLPGGIISTIQDTKLMYNAIDPGVAVTMEFEIMNEVKTGIEDSRKDVTIWSTHVGKELRQILIDLERCKQKNEVFTRKKQSVMLKSITETHHVIGFPLNFTYVNNEIIVREVLNTKIHEHQDSDVRFACAVYVHPYVNNVYSVWIYIVTLQDKLNL